MPFHPIRIIPWSILAASACLQGIVALAPRPGQPVAAIFPPWWSAARTFQAAAATGADILRLGALPSILVVAPGRGPSADNLPLGLHLAGAWLLLDARTLSACTSNT